MAEEDQEPRGPLLDHLGFAAQIETDMFLQPLATIYSEVRKEAMRSGAVYPDVYAVKACTEFLKYLLGPRCPFISTGLRLLRVLRKEMGQGHRSARRQTTTTPRPSRIRRPL